MRTKIYCAFGVVVAALMPLSVFGAGVVINEVAWMGMLPKAGESTQAAANNEWIELHNTGSSEESLAGWKLIITEEGISEITLAGTISPDGYFLLERGTDSVIPGVKADTIFSFKKGALLNTGENLILKDSNGSVIDRVEAHDGWPAGDNITKATMQRVQGKWITAPATPRMANVSVSSTPQSTPTLKPSIVPAVIAPQQTPIPNKSPAASVIPYIAAVVSGPQTAHSSLYGWMFALLGSFVAACIFFAVRRYLSHGEI